MTTIQLKERIAANEERDAKAADLIVSVVCIFAFLICFKAALGVLF